MSLLAWHLGGYRPFFGTGVLGGFTTFSTYAADVRRLLTEGQPGTALGYLAATLAAALAGVWLSATATRRPAADLRTLTQALRTIAGTSPPEASQRREQTP